MILAIPTAVKEHALALLRILRAHRFREIRTLNANVERRDLLNVNNLISGRLTREREINGMSERKKNPEIAPS